jgi:hypothetical protein
MGRRRRRLPFEGSRIRCGFPWPVARSRGPLMRIGCSAECCERRPCGSIGLPAAISTSRFLARPMAPSPSSSPVPLRTRVHPLVSFGLLSRVRTASNLPSARMRRAPSLGFSSQSRYQPRRSTCERASQAHPMFRPRRFARPRRFSLSTTSWACFIPQPRPGFAFQGFVPATQPAHLVGGPCPPVVDPPRLPSRCQAGSSSADLASRALIRVSIRDSHSSV